MHEVSGLLVGLSSHASRTRTMQRCGSSCSVPVTTWPLTGGNHQGAVGKRGDCLLRVRQHPERVEATDDDQDGDVRPNRRGYDGVAASGAPGTTGAQERAAPVGLAECRIVAGEAT